MGVIGDTLRENYFMIALSMLVFLVAAYFVWLLLSNILGIIKTYKRFTKRVDSSVETSIVKDKADDVIKMQIANILGEGDASASGDDYNPRPATQDSILREPSPEGSSIQKKIDDIKNIYSAYNKEITQYSRDVLKKEPDDLLDERILSKGDDVY
jgi:hypothetical protein